MDCHKIGPNLNGLGFDHPDDLFKALDKDVKVSPRIACRCCRNCKRLFLIAGGYCNYDCCCFPISVLFEKNYLIYCLHY